ncbi:MAG TPA: hypothetical protein VFN56_04870, partial [Candidatus Saccharimonadales bacterium]|nr:hypothetical protein [Candidatus Saccharimonadales bacterium]
LVERLKSANNILVTVSRNPSVDQLAACIGLTLVLNKQGKHATAVFSGQVPSTIEFLKPDETLERTTDSLRDFIIALDKSKADKLRYKVEDTVVKIFITPYRTSLSADDLEFSQGDFNVDAVVAIGVRQQQDLDEAITAHGRILHDATVATITTTPDGELGTINWHDPSASSLCELVEEVAHELGADLLDGQIATALLTGIVAETNRFSNEKTTPQTMSVSAALMSAGANQQLVASELNQTIPAETSHGSGDNDAGQAAVESAVPPKSDDGTLEITHPHDDMPAEVPEFVQEDVESNDPVAPGAPSASENEQPSVEASKPSRLITEPPVLGGTLTASSKPDTELEAPTDPLSLPPSINDRPILSHDEPLNAPEPLPSPGMQPAPADWVPPTLTVTPPSIDLPQPANGDERISSVGTQGEQGTDNVNETLSQLEKEVNSPHAQAPTPNLDAARSEVMDAINSVPPIPEPIQALNAQPVDLTVPHDAQPVAPAQSPSVEFDPQAFGVLNDPDVPPASAVPSVPEQNPAPVSPTQQPLNPEVLPSDPTIPPVPPPLPPSVYAPPSNTSAQ